VSRSAAGHPVEGHQLTTQSDGEEDTMTETQPGREPGAGPENEIREQVEYGTGYADPGSRSASAPGSRPTT
jgi:hypothetical protein